MDLRTYLSSAGRGTSASLARSVGVRPVMVSQWVSGAKPIPLERVRPIRQATNGAVEVWDMRPADWFVHWPELVDTEGAPDLPNDADGGRPPGSLRAVRPIDPVVASPAVDGSRIPAADPAVWPLATDRRTEPRGDESERVVAHG